MIRVTLATGSATLILSLSLWHTLYSAPIHRVQYSVTDLGTLGGAHSEARSINNLGEIVGQADIISGSALARSIHGPIRHAFLWKNGQMIDLDKTRSTYFSAALAINNHSACVGIEYSPGIRPHQINSACLWHGSARQDIPTLGGDMAYALSINDRGIVCGWSNVSGIGGHHGFIYQKGKITDLTLGHNESSIAYSVNDEGQIVGFVRHRSQSTEHAVMWVHHTMIFLANPFSAGTSPGSGSSEPYAISRDGSIVGMVEDSSGKVKPALWSAPTRLTILSTLTGRLSRAIAINNHRMIVGDSETAAKVPHACLWLHGKIIDLNNVIPAQSGWLLNTAHGINDHGEIVGVGTIHGHKHGFLLKPRKYA